ncbi:hypothetical protein [Arthrobacter sp.]|uniref:hypothetical protein n=1 Tax=Arthrobacter sp. TaxID=1667 RepID=UPI003A8F36B6
MSHGGYPDKGPVRTGTAGRDAAPGPAEERSRQQALTSLSWRLAGGDPQAMDEFYDLTCDRSYGLASALLGRSEETEALLYGAYMDAWRTIRNTPPTPGMEMRWVLSLVLNRYRQRCTGPDRASSAIPVSGE